MILKNIKGSQYCGPLLCGISFLLLSSYYNNPYYSYVF